MIEHKAVNADAMLELMDSGKVTRRDVDAMMKICFTYAKTYKHTKTIFGFNLSNPNDINYKENLLKCWYSLKQRFAPEVKEGSTLLSRRIGYYLSIDEISPESLGAGAIGNMATLFTNLINHSCYANVQRVIVNHQSILYVTRSIKAGEQLFCNFR